MKYSSFLALSILFSIGAASAQDAPPFATYSTLNEPWDWNPDMSPDGRYIAFERENHQTPDADLFIWDTQTRTVTPLVDSDGYDRFPRWSPDGEWIYYSHVAADGSTNWHWQMFKVRPDGSDITPVLPSEERRIGALPSPDGEWIMYNAPGDDDGVSQHIFISRPDGSEVRNLTAEAAALYESEVGYNWFFHPDWSPDGSTIVFMAGNWGEFEIDLWTINVQSGEATSLFSSPGTNQVRPSFSPDGEWIAFANGSGRYQLYQLFIVRADRTEAYPLDAATEWHARPDWSADGRSLIFHEVVHSGTILAKYDLNTGVTSHFGIPGGYEEEWRNRLPPLGNGE